MGSLADILYISSCIIDFVIIAFVSFRKAPLVGKFVCTLLLISSLFLLLFGNELYEYSRILTGKYLSYSGALLFFLVTFACVYILCHMGLFWNAKSLMLVLFIFVFPESVALVIVEIDLHRYLSLPIMSTVVMSGVAELSGGIHMLSTVLYYRAGLLKKRWCLPVRIISGAAAHSLPVIILKKYYSTTNALDAYQYSILLLLTVAFAGALMWVWERKNSRKTDDMIISYRKDADRKYSDTLIEAEESRRIFIHDIKNHLMTIGALSREGKSSEAYEYVNKLVGGDLLADTQNYCRNMLLNSILKRYAAEYSAVGADFQVNVFGMVLEKMSPDDITSVFCNLLDNALNSVRDKDDSFVYVSVAPQKEGRFTTVNVVNSCPEDPFVKGRELYTSTGDVLNHGYGLKSVKRIVEKYNGEMELYYSESEREFHAVILLEDV